MAWGRPGIQRPAWLRYGVAVVLTCLVVAARLGLDPWWGHQHNRHLVFIPTAMVAAWFGGFGPGVVSAALSTAALGNFWVDAAHRSAGVAIIEMVLFFAVCVAISAMVESLHRSRARAEAAGRSRERVLQIVAHDLRNPLGAIGLSAEGLRESARDEDRSHVDRIFRAVSRMDALIGDLVDVTRIEHGTLAVTPAREPVEPILRETAEAFLAQAERRRVTLDFASVAGDLVVSADRVRIVQLLGNLIGNALKFTPEGGRISVGVSVEDRQVRFEIADTGPGIPRDSLPHIFEPYWKGAGNGTGLGLFIALSIARAHGGDLWVRSAPGAGATFFFTLPRA